MDPTENNTALAEMMVAAANEGDEIDLRELFFYLLDKWRIIAVAAVVGLIIATVYTFQFVTPMYQSTAKLYVLSSKDSVLNLADMQIGNYLASDYQEVFKTWEVNERVRTNLGLDYSYGKLQRMVSISNPKDTRILYITVTSSNAAEVATIANEYAKVVSDYISLTMATETPNTFSTALRPLSPFGLNKTRNMMLGLMLGAFAATAALAAAFVLDDKIKTPEDIMKYTGMPVLAVIPVLDIGLLSGSSTTSKKRKQRKQ